MTLLPRSRWAGPRVHVAAVGLMCISAGIWFAWNHIPGTVRFTSDGNVRGTGTLRRYYPSGAIKVEAYHVNGLLIRDTFYRPDGSVIATSAFDLDRGGTFYSVCDDGTVECKLHCKFRPGESGSTPPLVADGLMVVYKPDGSIDEVRAYRDGQRAP